MKLLVFSLICFILRIVNAVDSCLPLWPRLQFGNAFHKNDDPQKLIIKFNTRSQCPKSYVVITDTQGSIKKSYCSSSIITTSPNMANYTTFIQRCSIDFIDYESDFGYIIYGSNSTSGSAIPFDFDPIQTSIMHPNSTQTTKLIFVADWGELHQKIGQYQSLNQSLDKIRIEQKAQGIIVNGDIGYDIDSNNGTNYQQFLGLVSRISRYLPIYINTGNREHNSVDDLKLLYSTFQQYEMDKRLATGLNLGNFYYVTFDPYLTVYKKNVTNLRLQQDPSLVGLASMIQQAKKTGKIIIVSSHYPLKCSAQNKNCQNDTQILKQFFDIMFQNQIKFYIGAHYHTYERIYPYCQNGTFNFIQPPYYADSSSCIISIIQGIAGNDQKIVQTYEVVQKYTAALSYNKTGLGLLQVNQDRLKFQHFSSENILTLKDQFEIIYGDKNEKLIQS